MKNLTYEIPPQEDCAFLTDKPHGRRRDGTVRVRVRDIPRWVSIADLGRKIAWAVRSLPDTHLRFNELEPYIHRPKQRRSEDMPLKAIDEGKRHGTK
jgi:hypothetical protein